MRPGAHRRGSYAGGAPACLDQHRCCHRSNSSVHSNAAQATATHNYQLKLCTTRFQNASQIRGEARIFEAWLWRKLETWGEREGEREERERERERENGVPMSRSQCYLWLNRLIYIQRTTCSGDGEAVAPPFRFPPFCTITHCSIKVGEWLSYRRVQRIRTIWSYIALILSKVRTVLIPELSVFSLVF